MSTKIHPKRGLLVDKSVHEKSPLLSTRSHLLCPRDFCHPHMTVSFEIQQFQLDPYEEALMHWHKIKRFRQKWFQSIPKKCNCCYLNSFRFQILTMINIVNISWDINERLTLLESDEKVSSKTISVHCKKTICFTKSCVHSVRAGLFKEGSRMEGTLDFDSLDIGTSF